MITRLRVLMICPQYRPIIGGYERAAERLSEALASRGHEVVVLTERRQKEWPLREELNGVSIRRFRSIYRPGFHTVTCLASVALCLITSGKKFDVIHVHHIGWLAALCVLFGSIARLPVVLKTASTGVGGAASHLSSGPLRLVRRYFHTRADAWVATSKQAAIEIRSAGVPDARIHEIPNGIDTDTLAPTPLHNRQKNRLALGVRSRLVVLFVGRLSEEKNPLGLVRAWSLLGPDSIDANLVIVGDGPLLAQTGREVRELDLGDSVHMVGALKDPTEWFRAADLFVLCSSREGLSNSLLEAISCGLPVVSTEVSGSSDLFRQSDIGRLVPVSDLDALKEAMRQLLEDDARRDLCAQASRSLAESSYSISGVAQRTEQLYLSLLPQRS